MSVLGTLGVIFGDVLSELPLIENVISGVERLFGHGNGEAKLTAATTSALSALQIYAETTGKKLPGTFQADLQAAINAIVQVKNDLGELLPHGAPKAS